MTKKALRLCFDAHKDQKDKSDLPYVFHPFHLAEQMTDEATTIVALLHDVIEDTDVTLADLQAEGFSREILDAVALLTHDKSVNYTDYVLKIKENPIAKAVKLGNPLCLVFYFLPKKRLARKNIHRASRLLNFLCHVYLTYRLIKHKI